MSSAPFAARPAGELTPDDADTWHRVHPVSPLVRGWVAVAGVMVVFGRNSIEDLLRDTARGRQPDAGGAPVWVLLGILAAAVIVFGTVFFLSWYFTRYQVTDHHVRVNSGFIFRQQRQARIDRVQAIDVVQPLLARLVGLAELRFDVADAGKSAMKLSFLRLEEAKRLRAAILATAAGTPYPSPVPGPVGGHDGPTGAATDASPLPRRTVQEAPEQQVLAVPAIRVLAATVLGGTTIAVLIIGAVLIAGAVAAGSFSVFFAAIPFVLGIGARYWSAFTTDFNFRVAASPDGVRLHYGMLETRSQTIPPGRVQAVGITQSLLWRPFGWYRIHVNVAGYGGEGRNNSNRTVVLPIGSRADVMTVLGLVFPDPGTERPFEVFTAGLDGSGPGKGFVPSPRSARFVDPLGWRRTAFLATRTALLCRHGVFTHRLQVVPHERTQSLSLFQGPVARRLGLVDFELHSTPGPVRPVVRHLALATARELFDSQASRAALARRLARPSLPSVHTSQEIP